MNNIGKDDPRLTAYALGELTGEEAQEITRAVENDPTLLAEVEAIRGCAAQLTAAFHAESLPQKLSEAAETNAVRIPAIRTRSRRRWMAASGLAVAASFVVVVGLLFLAPEPKPGSLSRVTLKCEIQDHRVISPAPEVSGNPSGGVTKVDLWKANIDPHKMEIASREFEQSQPIAAARVASSAAQSGAQPSGATAPASSAPQPAAAKSAKFAAGTGKMRSKQLQKERQYDIGDRSSESAIAIGEPPNARKSAPESAAPEMPVLTGTQPNIRRDEYEHMTEAYDKIVENEFIRVSEEPLSTFSVDVDTASYANVRRMLNGGQLPPPGAVRLEELINYFDYDYAPPTDGSPFATHMKTVGCPWNEKHLLLRVGLKGRILQESARPAFNLVFLLDVSRSMNHPNKLPLVKEGMKLLVNQLTPKDRVAIAVYAGASGLVLPSTPCSEKRTILDALDRLEAGGSTNGASGIQLAYATAAGSFLSGGVNRVILCTDGDFNVGVTNQSELTDLIEKKAKEQVFLTVLGFGRGNLKDSTLEKLADKGNGNYGYIDTMSEAKKLLVEQLTGTLVTIAKDVKLQVEFNPARVQAYRLLGYENRKLNKEDFNDDKKDAGEIGAGHTVTALYELVPAGIDDPVNRPKVDPLKYQPAGSNTTSGSESDTSVPVVQKKGSTPATAEMLTLKLRYKEPDGNASRLLEFPCTGAADNWESTDGDLRFATSVAAFGMLLRGSQYAGSADWGKVLGWAERSMGADRSGYRAEFLQLVRVARSLNNR